LEQTTSAGYANLVVLQYLKRTGRHLPAVEQKASLNVAETVARIRSFANSEGGSTSVEIQPILPNSLCAEFLTEARVRDGRTGRH
jgi:hypothetical protein